MTNMYLGIKLIMVDFLERLGDLGVFFQLNFLKVNYIFLERNRKLSSIYCLSYSFLVSEFIMSKLFDPF